MVCPVCGKCLKHFFALNGHMRLKGDDLHQIYFEAHKMQYFQKESTDLKNLIEESTFSIIKKIDGLTNKYDRILLIVANLMDMFNKNYMPSAMPIKQQEVRVEKPVVKPEENDIKGKKTLTFAELIKKYRSFENALEYVDHWILLDIINKDPYLDLSRKLELNDIVSKKWLGH